MKKIIFLAFVLSSLAVAKAQIVVKGQVRNSTYKPIAGASVKLATDTVGSVTDSLGNFVFSTLKTGDVTVVASLLGYKTDSVVVKLIAKTVYSLIILKDVNQQLNTVQIQTRKAFNPPNQELSHGMITTAIAPGAAADVTAAMQVFPGAAPIANETGFFVRGGHANETLIVFDGMVVKNAFGSKLPDLANRSRFSAFLFDKTNFTTSGYSAMYGQALSSVLTMDTRDLPPASSTEFAIINLGLGVARTERFKNSSLTIGANYYNFSPYHQLVKQNTLWKDDPKQYQTSLNYKHKLKKGTFKAFVDYSDTELSFDIINPNTSTSDLLKNRNKNLYINTNYQGQLSHYWKIYFGTAYNKTTEQGDFGNSPYFQNDDLLQQKLMFTASILGAIPLRMGAEYFYNERKEGINNKERGYTDLLSAAFTELDANLLPQLSLNLGFRTEYSRYMDKVNASPRIAAIYNPTKDHKFTASYGQYLQKPDDSFLAVSNQLNFEKNIQYAIDYEFPLKRRLVKLAAYHKKYSDLTKITTPFFSGFQAYGPPLDIQSVKATGSGFANGFELFFKDKESVRYAEYFVSYSWVNTKRNFIDYAMFATPTFAPKHTLNANFQKFSNKLTWIFAVNYAYNHGRTYFNPNNAALMGDKVKDFHNLSASISHIPRWGKTWSSISLNVNNILGFKQVYGYRYAFSGVQRIPVLPTAKRSVLLSLLVNLDGQDYNR
ncbi:TonB-dependent receptor [Pedobacter sp. UBA4863]|uniref:TonB-dependent receptor n=1 Tax=Pedobacter sp. UBA4863 TaxID=1947060 RepID=UPI0025FC0DAE|nr:TonB-dependent receptor [Pedobacter sp. UBA4863]